MTKIEELRAAFEATTGGEWDWGQHLSVTNISFSEVRTADGEDILFHSAQPALVENSDNAQFTALAHNLMPALLEAVDVIACLRRDTGHVVLMPLDQVERINAVLEKLK